MTGIDKSALDEEISDRVSRVTRYQADRRKALDAADDANEAIDAETVVLIQLRRLRSAMFGSVYRQGEDDSSLRSEGTIDKLWT